MITPSSAREFGSSSKMTRASSSLRKASDGQEALRLVAEHLPEVAVLDIQMPVMTGIEATRRIKATHPAVRVLILTAYEDDPYVFALLRAGADSYILKTASPDELVHAVRTTAAGGAALSPDVAAKVVAQITSGSPAAAHAQIEPLSERELAVLQLAGQGLTNKAIGLELGISEPHRPGSSCQRLRQTGA